MKIFVVNCGSSSIKYQMFSMTKELVLAKGVLERVGTDEACLKHTAGEAELTRTVPAKDHGEGLQAVLEALTHPDHGVLSSVDDIEGVGHRVVHGGVQMTDSVLIDDHVIRAIERNAELAPLHNPPNLSGIKGAMAAMPNVGHVAVFDTAFLSSMPARAYRYAVPQEWYHDHHVRKYGFHGTSHRYVTYRAADLLGKSAGTVNLITCHLGNGCSMTAVQQGRAVDHTMGMTPLEGLMMGTRTGDIDPAVVVYMQGRGLSAEEIDREMNKKSGLLGVSGLSNDMRDLLAASSEGNERAQLAIDMFAYRIAKYIGAYHAILPSLDAVVFTGGIGENSHPVRAMIVNYIASLGAALEPSRNASTIRGKCGPITTNGAKLPVWIIPTNEELMIARDARRIVANTPRAKR